MPDDFDSSIRDFIAENFLFRADRNSIADDESLLESGLIDSTGVLELIAFLEQRYGITVADEEIIPDNLDSIGNIGNYLRLKRAPVRA
ncbi:acyl carrier protein [Rhizobiaceae bacterium n13]|uniref:Acyl carrier protein n=1 Tax=Ferirhizobium litorale TaxID=2927786 RepID=A0AAE3QEU1_9HYPH|nr:acyl carrier protein [Fererhizobium litorale]MDI7861830.1 acyl carrier protein [Fererhizobium litorale]MDI7921828.1 acyl carrier protein [Fererhizobium litorale]